MERSCRPPGNDEAAAGAAESGSQAQARERRSSRKRCSRSVRPAQVPRRTLPGLSAASRDWQGRLSLAGYVAGGSTATELLPLPGLGVRGSRTPAEPLEPSDGLKYTQGEIVRHGGRGVRGRWSSCELLTRTSVPRASTAREVPGHAFQPRRALSCRRRARRDAHRALRHAADLTGCGAMLDVAALAASLEPAMPHLTRNSSVGSGSV